MDLKDTFTVEAPREKVWDLFWDFPRLAACLPGCESIERIDDSNFKARVAQRVGPFQIALDLNLTLDDVQQNKSVAFSGSGGDKRGNNLKITRAALKLDPVSDAEDLCLLRHGLHPVWQARHDGQLRRQTQGRRDAQGVHAAPHRSGRGVLTPIKRGWRRASRTPNCASPAPGVTPHGPLQRPRIEIR